MTISSIHDCLQNCSLLICIEINFSLINIHLQNVYVYILLVQRTFLHTILYYIYYTSMMCKCLIYTTSLEDLFYTSINSYANIFQYSILENK